jgi:hypothetical protein
VHQIFFGEELQAIAIEVTPYPTVAGYGVNWLKLHDNSTLYLAI